MAFYLSTQIYPKYRANCIRNLNSEFALFKDFYTDLSGTYPENTEMKGAVSHLSKLYSVK